MHIEQGFRIATSGIQADRPGTMIDQIQLETGQMATQISKDAIGADVARWIARIERDQRAQMFKGCPQQFAHCACSRLTCAHSVELMP